ncbi:MAG: prolipoprotein diacylglyceryl transferase [Vampirovibrionales bacterium]
MHPILFSLFGFHIYGFGLMVGLGLASGLAWAWKRLATIFGEADSSTLLHALPWLGLIGLLGARLMYVVYHPSEFMADPVGFLTASGGMVWYGGVLAGVLAVWLWSRYQHRPLLPLTDALLPPLMLGLALGRVGCLLAGCCYGGEADVPWAIHYPHTHPTQGVAVHPVPVYETLGALALCGASLWLEKRPALAVGSTTALIAVGYGVLRFINEALRGDRLMVATPLEGLGQWLPSLSASQWMSLACLIVGGVIATKRYHNATTLSR